MERIQIHEIGTMAMGEEFPIIGELSRISSLRKIMKDSLVGRSLYGDCLGKAVHAFLGISELIKGFPRPVVVMGSLFVYNHDMTARYGFEYHIDEIPREFHAWVEIGNIIIDPALPGVILRGLQMVDEYGSILEGREPAMLAGTAPKWCEYLKKETYAEFLIREQY